MTTSPIIAAAVSIASLLKGSAGQSAPADKSEFQQVLQQVKSGASAGVSLDLSSAANSSSGYSSSFCLPGNSFSTLEKVTGDAADIASPETAIIAAQVNSADTNLLDNPCASHLKFEITSAPVASQTEKGKTSGRSISLDAKPNAKKLAKEVGPSHPAIVIPTLCVVVPTPMPVAALPVSPTETIVTAQDPSGTQPSNALRSTVAASSDATAIPFTPAARIDPTVQPAFDLSLPQPTSAHADPVVTPLPASTPVAPIDSTVQPSIAPSFPQATSAPADLAVTPLPASTPFAATALPDNSPAEALPAMAESASVANGGSTPLRDDLTITISVGHKAGDVGATVNANPKPQSVTSTENINAAAPPTGVASKTTIVFKTSQHTPELHAPTKQETLADGKPSLSHSTNISAADPASGEKIVHSGHTQWQSKSEHDDPSTAQQKAPAPATSIDHGSVSAAAPVNMHAAFMQTASLSPEPLPASPPVTQPAPAVAAQTTQVPVPAPTQAQPQIQSNPIPDPPRMVDSGQLHVDQNKSELKVSVQVPELGKIEVRAVTTHDGTTAHLTASRPEALQLLATDRTGLEQALKARDVILGSLNSHAQGESSGQYRQQNSHSQTQTSGGISSSTIAPNAPVETIPSGILPDLASISFRA